MPDSGTYDEMVEVHSDTFVDNIADADACLGDWDDDGIQADNVVGSTAWTPAGVTGH